MTNETTEDICKRALDLSERILKQTTMSGNEAMASVLLRSLVIRMVGVLEKKVEATRGE